MFGLASFQSFRNEASVLQFSRTPSGPGRGQAATAQGSRQCSPVAIFWDFENCPPPRGLSGYDIAESLRRVAHTCGSLTSCKAYVEGFEKLMPNKSLRTELQSSGISLIDCPSNGGKNVADQMMIVDMMAFALDNGPPATIVLISGDRDFAYALSTLRNRQYHIILLTGKQGAHLSLKAQAHEVLDWRVDVLRMGDMSVHDASISNAEKQRGLDGKQPGESPIFNNDAKQAATPKVIPRTNFDLPMQSSCKGETGTVGASSFIALENAWRQLDDPICTIRKVPLPLRPIPSSVQLLVTILNEFKLRGDRQPLRSKVGAALLLRDPLIYAADLTGVRNFAGLAVNAEKLRLVRLGGEDGRRKLRKKGIQADRVQPYGGHKLTCEAEALLRVLVTMNGNQWTTTAKIFNWHHRVLPNEVRRQCEYRFLEPADWPADFTFPVPCTPEGHALIDILVMIHGTDWRKVARKFNEVHWVPAATLRAHWNRRWDG
ncbi:hypothetical protein SpCBS45565_g06899 [Spizellomyces sp. 'palustris']|nr:hypothetical protein SpCBS45565_g06899 [Spizellomyces sp. 'palustris']